MYIEILCQFQEKVVTHKAKINRVKLYIYINVHTNYNHQLKPSKLVEGMKALCINHIIHHV